MSTKHLPTMFKFEDDSEFRIGKRNEGYIMSVYLEGIGYVGFKSCNSMSECWNTLNNFNINYLFS